MKCLSLINRWGDELFISGVVDTDDEVSVSIEGDTGCYKIFYANKEILEQVKEQVDNLLKLYEEGKPC